MSERDRMSGRRPDEVVRIDKTKPIIFRWRGEKPLVDGVRQPRDGHAVPPNREIIIRWVPIDVGEAVVFQRSGCGEGPPIPYEATPPNVVPVPMMRITNCDFNGNIIDQSEMPLTGESRENVLRGLPFKNLFMAQLQNAT